jgi:hypothetical protein
MPFRVVQPWGPDKVRQSTLLSEHQSSVAAFAEIDRLVAQMSRTGVPSDALELVVIDVNRSTVIRRLDSS